MIHRAEATASAASTSRSPSPRAGRPPVTSREEILAAARRVIDRDGWEKLTVRGLAGELGIGTTTLYHHVRDREDLMVHLIDDHVGRLARPDLPDDPRGRIVAAATALHDTLAAVPWAAEVLTVDGFVGRLSDTTLWFVETILAGAIDEGCTPDEAVTVFRSLWYYTVGELLVRVHSAGDTPVDRRRLLDREVTRFGTRDAAVLPTLAAVGDRWPELARRDTYRAGLRAFVDGLLASAARPAT